MGIPDDIDEENAVVTILDFMNPLLSEISWLAKDTCATHVIRSAFCVLAGLPVVSEKRGKNAKHQHSVGLSEPLENMLKQPDGFFIDSSFCFSVPDSFHGSKLL